MSRSAARKRALDLLYQADLGERDPAAHLAAQTGWLDDFTVRLVEGVAAHHAELDREIEQRAEGWTLRRMPVIDRNVLRLGLFELLHADDIPAKVAIDEAIELVKSLSTDASPAFVNGILAAAARDRGLL